MPSAPAGMAERAAANGAAVALERSAREEFVRRATAENAGGRPVAKLVEEFAALPLAELFIDGKTGGKLKLAYAGGKFRYA